MSSPATQYVYIPNLVGRQMLRIPLDDVEAEGQISIASTQTSKPAQTSSYARESSPSPSEESIEENE